MVNGFCQGCPTPENLTEYRNGRPNGGYFSDPGVLEAACRLVESVADSDGCTTGPEIEDFDDEGGERLRICNHPANWVMSQIGDAMERSGESPDVIIRIESKQRE